MNAVRWRRLRQYTQVVSFALFLLLAFMTYRGAEFILPLDLFYRLDPLVGFGAMIASRAIVAAMLLSFVMLALGIVLGRIWCGWLCPLGAILDWVSPRSPRKVEPHKNWRSIKYVLLGVIFVAALLGNLSLLIFDPLTLLNRAFGAAFVPALNVLVVSAETILYPLPPLQPLLDGFEANVRGTLLPAQQTYSQLGWLLASVLGAVVALNWIVPRFWCRYLCPLGAVYALEARFAWLRPHSVAECAAEPSLGIQRCARCVRVCPTGAIGLSKQGLSIDPAECTLCLDCVAECPAHAIEFRPGVSSVVHSSFDLTRRQALTSIVMGVASVTLFRSAPSAWRPSAVLIRPPGGLENDLLSKCVRCAECVKVCPTGGLQPSLLEGGLEGLWTPVLTPRLGYCDYSCNACGQICPTGAIPRLALAEKRQTVIGTAYIDTNRCIPWASFRTCIVCQEMCPVPVKAVKLEEVDVTAPDGTNVHLQRPRVQHDICIGCGICEYQCPLNGPAAIRVYVPMSFPPLA
jgi:polyferredoxin